MPEIVAATQPLGQPMDRVDGKLKVTGGAKYAAEYNPPGMVHAVAFTSTIARGRVTKMDSTAARSAPGVIEIITSENTPKFGRGRGPTGQSIPVLQDDQVHYAGQFLGLVVARTWSEARHAASLVKVDYEVEKPVTEMVRPEPSAAPTTLTSRGGPYTRGDYAGASASAPVKVEQVYTTAIETHNPMELHATIAAWDGDRLTLYDATQHVQGVQGVIAGMLNIAPENIRVIAPYMGGGFGCKGSVWPHTALAAVAAKVVGRPVKLMLTRQQMFTQVGHRPRTQQTLTLASDHDGKLLAISHDNLSSTSDTDNWTENSSNVSRFLYSCENVHASQTLAHMNTGTPCQMRAPGEASGAFALEVAMDELAYANKLDPMELRIRNYAITDPMENKPYSSKALMECYKMGAARFGWQKRTMDPGSMKQGSTLIGWGMATAHYPTHQGRSSAMARIFPDGRALITAAAHDLGTGTYTILTQIASEYLGIAPEKIRVELGDTTLPASVGAGGSTTATTVGNAVQAACRELLSKMASSMDRANGPFAGKWSAEDLKIRDGNLTLQKTKSMPLADIFAANGNRPIDATATTQPTPESNQYAKGAWGAHFVEVQVDASLGTIRVSRYVGAFAAGRILNAKTARSQLVGSLTMSIGMTLLEQTRYHGGTGRVINDNLADYLLPVNADTPPMDILFVEEIDPHVNPLGTKGLGELGMVGAPAAIANAIYHATGKRMRDLPIHGDMLLV